MILVDLFWICFFLILNLGNLIEINSMFYTLNN